MAGEGPLGDWSAALQKAQSDLMRQWMDMNAAWARTAQAPAAAAGGAAAGGAAAGAAAGAGPAAAPAAEPGDVAGRFLAQCEQYLGVSRSLWDLVGRAAATPDVDARMRVFNEGLTTLQQQFAGLWAATPLGAAPAAAGLAGFPGLAGMPGMAGMPPGNPFAAFASAFAGAPGVAGFGGNPMAGFGGLPGGLPGLSPGAFAGLFAQPALGPGREQQQAWQRMGQLAARCGQAQLGVVNQWNDIIGRAVRELGERLAPKLKEGAAPGSMKEVYDLWVDSAEGVYAQAARNASFVQAQAEFTNSLASLRTAQRELVEEWARQFDLPTRAELNSIHQQLRELKAALRR